MARVKGAMMTRKRRKKILKRAKGYWGSKSTHYRVANQAVSTRSVTSAVCGSPASPQHASPATSTTAVS